MSEPRRIELNLLGQTLTIRSEASPDYLRRLAKFLEDRVAQLKRSGVNDPLTAARIESALREEAGPLLRRLELFDVFRFSDGRSSLAWRLLFQADDRTLTDAEVNAIQERVVRRITETFHITLRSS